MNYSIDEENMTVTFEVTDEYLVRHTCKMNVSQAFEWSREVFYNVSRVFINDLRRKAREIDLAVRIDQLGEMPPGD